MTLQVRESRYNACRWTEMDTEERKTLAAKTSAKKGKSSNDDDPKRRGRKLRFARQET